MFDRSQTPYNKSYPEISVSEQWGRPHVNEGISSIDGIGTELDQRHEHVPSEVPFAQVTSVYQFFGGGGRALVLESISSALENGESCVHVSGESGSGKTMLATVLAERCMRSHQVVRFDADELSVPALLHHLVIELCPRQLPEPALTVRGKLAKERLVELSRDAVQEQLASGTSAARPVLLLIDSVSVLRPPVMRLLKQLSEIHHGDQRMFQFVIFECVEHDSIVAAGVQRCGERPVNHHRLRRLTLAEIGQYLQHHMLLLDFNRRDIFTREMAYFIADRSEGVIGAVNAIARSAFTIARLEKSDRPSLSHLLVAGLPQREEPMPRRGFVARHRKVVFALLGSTVVASTATLVLLSVR